MAAPSDPSAALVFELVRELHQIRAKRFEWTLEVHDQVITTWREHFHTYDDWFRRASAAISDLNKAGHTELADKLACTLLDRARVHDPGNFSISIPTGFGRESWQIVGSDAVPPGEQRQPSLSTTHREVPEERLEIFRPALPEGRESSNLDNFQAADPVDIDLKDLDTSGWPVVSLLDAIRQKLWISYTREGLAFCVQCDCPQMVLPGPLLGGSSQGKHVLYPRHFHVDPFHKDNALVHFLTVHRKGFEDGPKQMLEEYGHIVRLDAEDGEPVLDAWAIAAHNISSAARFQQLLSAWEGLRGRYHEHRERVQPNRSRASRSLQAGRTIDAASVPGQSCVFSVPDAGDWVIICTHPECLSPFFTANPLNKDRAITHFQSHGIFLQDQYEVLELFGLKVLGNDPDGSEESAEEEMADEEPAADDPGPRKISGRPRLIDGRAEYYRWGTSSLREECKRRNIPVPKASENNKRALEKKLKLNDGLPLYESHSEWPFERLQAECLTRGLPINSKHLGWGIKRKELEKQLESDDVRRRQGAASSAQPQPARAAFDAGPQHGPDPADLDMAEELGGHPRSASLEPPGPEPIVEAPTRAASLELPDTEPKQPGPRGPGRPKKSIAPSKLPNVNLSKPNVALPIRQSRRVSSIEGPYKEPGNAVIGGSRGMRGIEEASEEAEGGN